MRRVLLGVGTAVSVVLSSAWPVAAHAPSGAIFTTLPDGSEVNFNHFPSKEAVYLDGGPGPGAPQNAAGLDNGTYVFQVTNPNGETLLSTDRARCRQFTVADGVISSVVDTDCEHATGTDVDHAPAKTVQLMPYLDTPNPGGVYKVWVTFLADFLDGCAALGVANGLDVVDCGNAPGNRHGFVPGHSKTDNFKVKDPGGPVEIDTRFFHDQNRDGHRQANEAWLDGRVVTWTDTHGATNQKWSYLDLSINVNHEAHVEAPEAGVHQISIADQRGCKVGLVHIDGVDQNAGPQTVSVQISSTDANRTVFIDVACR
jgi:hypothetical protein